MCLYDTVVSRVNRSFALNNSGPITVPAANILCLKVFGFDHSVQSRGMGEQSHIGLL